MQNRNFLAGFVCILLGVCLQISGKKLPAPELAQLQSSEWWKTKTLTKIRLIHHKNGMVEMKRTDYKNGAPQGAEDFRGPQYVTNNAVRKLPTSRVTQLEGNGSLEDSFGAIGNSDQSYRGKKQADLDPDEIPADEVPLPGQPGAGKGKPQGLGYPNAQIPGVTCLTARVVAKKKKAKLARLAKPKCPRVLPCRRSLSCGLWKQGLIKKTLQINMEESKKLYDDVFRGLHPKRLEEIFKSWDLCIQYYKLNEPFKGAAAEASTLSSDISHTHKPKREVELDAGEPVDAEPEIGEGEGGLSWWTRKDEPPGLTDCNTRVKNFLECDSIINLKAYCYWPPHDADDDY